MPNVTGETQTQVVQHRAQKLASIGLLAEWLTHDLHDLLTKISAQTSLASAQLQSQSSAHSHVAEVNKIADQASQITQQLQDLLAYASHSNFQTDPLTLNELVRKSKEIFQAWAPPAVKLQLHLSPDLPFITGNKGQLEQVVTDLLISTAEAIDANRGIVRATTGIEEVTIFDERQCVGHVRLEAGHYVYLIVTNANENATHETIPIFNPFFSTKELGGTLGLSVLRDIIDAHKGGLQVQRQLGVGTTFKILLPVSKVDAAAVAEQPPSAQNDKRAVLVVDDEATIRQAVAEVLELLELNVLTAADGREGIELFKQHSRDIGLVLLDMNMPVMSGEEAYQRLREIDPQVKVVVSSGRPETEVRERLGKSGAPSFLAKPYDTDTLLTRVKAELSV